MHENKSRTYRVSGASFTQVLGGGEDAHSVEVLLVELDPFATLGVEAGRC
jgi:hypothetical protein